MFNKINYLVITALLLAGTLASCGSGTVQTGGTDSNGARLSAISVTPTNPTIAKNTSQNFTATGIYSDNSTKDLTASVTWSVSDTNVASIGIEAAIENGSMFKASSKPGTTQISHGKALGKTTVTATSGDIFGSTTLTVSGATLVYLAITPSNASIAKSTNQQFVAMGTFSDNTTQDLSASVAWSSSDSAVATINASGLASAGTTGLTTITATSGTVSTSASLTVTPATLVSLTVTPTNPSIANGTNQQFIATGIYSDNLTQDLTTSVIWNSSNTSAVTISTSGLARSVATGTTTITATSETVSGTTTLSVTPATLASITVTPNDPGIAMGTNQQFIATGTYSDNTAQNLTTVVTWSSSSTNIATISNAADSIGLGTSVATGSTTITAISGMVSGATTLTVTPATLVSLAISPINPSIAKGTTRQFMAIGTYSDGAMQNLTTAVTWNSSDTGVSTISNAAGYNGLAKSVATGSTMITAISGSISASTPLTVTPATLVSLAVTPVNTSIAAGSSQQFTATGTYSDGSNQTLTTSVTWSSSSTSVAAISNAAGSNGLATSIISGTTMISAIAGSISATTTLAVIANSSVGSATLSWDAPATNTDGTPLTNLAGYKIYYGTASGIYTKIIEAGNVTTYVINNIAPGTYYFAVTAYDILQNESDYSNEAIKTIQ